MQNNAQLVPEQEWDSRGYIRRREGGNTMTESKKINFCFNYKADKTLGSSEHSKRGQVAAWGSPKVNRALVRALLQSPHTHNTRGPLSGKQKHVRRDRERRLTADLTR